MSEPEVRVSDSGTTHRSFSLRTRLLWGTLAGAALALLVTGMALTAMFKNHVISQFQAALERQLDQLLVELEFDSAGNPRMDATSMFDPRLQKPYSGLYWQVDELLPGSPPRIGILRSRSLWDSVLNVAASGQIEVAHGRMQVSYDKGPAGELLLVIRRVFTTADAPGRTFRLLVAGDLRFNLAATRRFGSMFGIALLLLLVLLGLAAWAQVSIGLRPLKGLQGALKDVRAGRQQRLVGGFPDEVQPLVNEFNQVLAANEAMLQRAQTQAGNLAHALKTPLAVLENETERALRTEGVVSVGMLKEQLEALRHHVNWHLMRARAAAGRDMPGRSSSVVDSLRGVLRVLERVFADRTVNCRLNVADRLPAFAGEAQDLQEILGNLLENAFKWAKSDIRVAVSGEGQEVCICIEDDGPGIEPSRLSSVMQRGVRLDETTPGTGLGLAIVQELVSLYEGRFQLGNVPAGGLGVKVWLPAVADH